MPDTRPPNGGGLPVAADLQLITQQEIATMLRVHRTTVDSLRRTSGFPTPVRLGGHRLRWRLSDVREWIEKGGAEADETQSADAN